MENSIVPVPDPSVAGSAEPAMLPDTVDSACEGSLVDLRETLFNDGCKGTEGRFDYLPRGSLARGVPIENAPDSIEELAWVRRGWEDPVVAIEFAGVQVDHDLEQDV